MFKLNAALVPDLPAPRPKFELFVYSPRFEGVHLRFANVARGGLRWSDRREDFRTEILGLAKAQEVKNSVIVPSGAKGGFVCKQLPDPADREAYLGEVLACYRMFISAMLDVTDNLVAGPGGPAHAGRQARRRRPVPGGSRRQGDRDVLRHGQRDRAEPRLLAGGRVRLWRLGRLRPQEDGHHGSRGVGIGQVPLPDPRRRHRKTDFTVAGIGDMSGDVFGNGMLLSEHIKLVAAFDHRHVFLDPDPDPAASFAERRRMFDLPRSSWADYDTSLISDGGGVWPRSAKSIPVSPQVSAVLGLEGGVTALAPDQLISAILAAPVDLLWNGGIGTYVKASNQSNADVGDRSNDAVRIDASQLRTRVVGEGGNLGLTQEARIEYCAGRRARQHRLHRQLGRRGHLGSRGQHQDPA